MSLECDGRFVMTMGSVTPCDITGLYEDVAGVGSVGPQLGSQDTQDRAQEIGIRAGPGSWPSPALAP